jgi:hypothetical protein
MALGAHSLRAAFLTKAARRNTSVVDAGVVLRAATQKKSPGEPGPEVGCVFAGGFHQ